MTRTAATSAQSRRPERWPGAFRFEAQIASTPVFGWLLAACVSISAASFNYLFGASIAYIGNTTVGILGCLIGLIVGLAQVYLASGLICYRHGVDPEDAAKKLHGHARFIVAAGVDSDHHAGLVVRVDRMTGKAAGRLQQVLFNPEARSITALSRWCRLRCWC